MSGDANYAARLAAYVEQMVAKAPPLSDERLDEIVRLLRTAGSSTAPGVRDDPHGLQPIRMLGGSL